MTPEPKYPKDVLCNMLNLNGTVLANLGVMDPNIYTCLEDAGLKMRHVNQGYTRCATAVVAKDAIITMDLGIRALAQFLGIDVLLVHEENVFLDGYDYGFLGGCCGLIDKNVLAFTGKLDSLECAAEIRAFLEKHCVQSVSYTHLFQLLPCLRNAGSSQTRKKLKGCATKTTKRNWRRLSRMALSPFAKRNNSLQNICSVVK